MKNIVLHALVLSLFATGYSADAIMTKIKKIGKNAVESAEIDQQDTQNKLQKARAALEKDEAALARAQSTGNIKSLANLSGSIAKGKILIQKLEEQLNTQIQKVQEIREQQANMSVEDKKAALAEAKAAIAELQKELMRVKKEIIDDLNKAMKLAQSMLKTFEKKSSNAPLLTDAFNSLLAKIEKARLYITAIQNAELNQQDAVDIDDDPNMFDNGQFNNVDNGQFGDAPFDNGQFDDSYEEYTPPQPPRRMPLRRSSSSENIFSAASKQMPSPARAKPPRRMPLRRSSSSENISGAAYTQMRSPAKANGSQRRILNRANTSRVMQSPTNRQS